MDGSMCTEHKTPFSSCGMEHREMIQNLGLTELGSNPVFAQEHTTTASEDTHGWCVLG